MHDSLFNILCLFSAGVIPGLIAFCNVKPLKIAPSPPMLFILFISMILSGIFWLFYGGFLMITTGFMKLHYRLSWNNDAVQKQYWKNARLFGENIKIDNGFYSLIRIMLIIVLVSLVPMSLSPNAGHTISTFFRNIISYIGIFLTGC